MRTVIFDLDGTLVDTSRDLVAAANACFRAEGLGDLLDPVADAATAFAGGRAMLRLGAVRAGLGWDEARIDASYPLLLDAYEAGIDRDSVIYPGAREAVDRLRGAGFAVAICTNKPARLAEVLMHRLGFRDVFGALVGADTLPLRKPDPAPLREAIARIGGSTGRAALVGDTVTDRETARAAGLPAILVTFGPTGGAVAALGPEGLLEHYDHIEAVAEPLVR